jgi:hypothetical protein
MPFQGWSPPKRAVGRKHRAQNSESWRSRPRTPKGEGEGEAAGCAPEVVPEAGGGNVMRPKFDDADLSWIEIHAHKYHRDSAGNLLIDLVHEVRLYQDEVAALKIQLDMCRGDERDDDD